MSCFAHRPTRARDASPASWCSRSRRAGSRPSRRARARRRPRRVTTTTAPRSKTRTRRSPARRPRARGTRGDGPCDILPPCARRMKTVRKSGYKLCWQLLSVASTPFQSCVPAGGKVCHPCAVCPRSDGLLRATPAARGHPGPGRAEECTFSIKSAGMMSSDRSRVPGREHGRQREEVAVHQQVGLLLGRRRGHRNRKLRARRQRGKA